MRKGLGYDLADVGVITNISEDHIGIDRINTLEELAFVKSLSLKQSSLTAMQFITDDRFVLLYGS